jgi:hypothetical protein
MDALGLVYRQPRYLLLAAVLFAVMAIFYLWSSQVLLIANGSISFLVEPPFIAAALVLAFLFALTLPMQVYAVRLAATSAQRTGGTVLGAVLGTASMTCCAPVLLPSLLSLLGFSGTSILGINGMLHRYWLPLATLGIILLAYSLFSVVQGLNRECAIELPQGDVLDGATTQSARTHRVG